MHSGLHDCRSIEAARDGITESNIVTGPDCTPNGAVLALMCIKAAVVFSRQYISPFGCTNGSRAMTLTTPALSISREKICFFIVKAREFDVKDVVTDPDSGSNPSDDAMISVLEDHADDATQQELRMFIDALTEDEQIDLVALTWLGRGDGEIGDWDELRAEAERLHNNRTAAYLLAKPMLPDHLEEGLAQFGYRCDDF